MKPLHFFIVLIAALDTGLAQGIPTVQTVAPTKATEAAIYEVPGRTEPIESATVFTRATGIIRERRFEIGDVAKAGDVLALVDAPEINRAAEAARANVEQAIARAANARSLSNRSTRLPQSEVVSREESSKGKRPRWKRPPPSAWRNPNWPASRNNNASRPCARRSTA
jgi:multidrug efflux pump subunit AcrA (membrane-fusion protein)